MNDLVTPVTQTCVMILISECVQDLALLVRGSQEGCSIAFVIDVSLSMDWQQNKKRCVNRGKTSGERKTYIQEFKVEKMPFPAFIFLLFLIPRNSCGWKPVGPPLAVKQSPVGITDPGVHRPQVTWKCFNTGKDIVRRGVADY